MPASRQTDATATSGPVSAAAIGKIPLDLVSAAGFRLTGRPCGFGGVVLGGAVAGGSVCGGGVGAGVVGVGVGAGLLFTQLQVGVGVDAGLGLVGLLFTLGVGVAVSGVDVGVLVAVGVLVGVGVLGGVGVVGVGVGPLGVGVAVQLSQPPAERDRVTEATELPAVAASAVPPAHRASTAVASATTTEAAVHLMGHLPLWSH